MVAIAGFLPMFFFLTLYMQTVLGYSPIQTGAAYLPLTGGFIIAAGISSQLFARIGTKPVVVAGALIAAGGLYWLSRIPVDGSYVSDILPGPAGRLARHGRRLHRPDHRSQRRRRRGQGRPRRRAPQHRPAARRRARPRDPLRARDRAHQSRCYRPATRPSPRQRPTATSGRSPAGAGLVLAAPVSSPPRPSTRQAVVEEEPALDLAA